jgi:hypothetical protein
MDNPKIVAGLVAVIDTLWGAIAVLPFDWTRPNDAVLGISFVLGLPAYLLDLWIKPPVVIFLPALALLRGFATHCIGAPTSGEHLRADDLFSQLVHFCAGSPTLGWQLRGTELLIAAALLLQWSKLRNRREPRTH